MRDYGKVHSTFWSSPTVAALPEDAKLLALYLMTCGHGTIAGVFRLPDGYIAEDLGPSWTAERVSAAFEALAATGFARRCTATKWAWIVKHLEWNKPENPNQRKAAAKVASSIPTNCAWVGEFMRQCGMLLGLLDEQPLGDGFGKPLDEPLGEPSTTVVSLFANQKQEQKQEQEQEQKNKKPSALSAAKLPPCPHQEILVIFGKHLPMLPQPKPEMWGGARAKHLAVRWKWLFSAKNSRTGELYARTAADALAWFDRYFGYVAGSNFLTGRDGRWSGCDLGWLVNEENMAKVVQGNYQNKEAAT